MAESKIRNIPSIVLDDVVNLKCANSPSSPMVLEYRLNSTTVCRLVVTDATISYQKSTDNRVSWTTIWSK